MECRKISGHQADGPRGEKREFADNKKCHFRSAKLAASQTCPCRSATCLNCCVLTVSVAVLAPFWPLFDFPPRYRLLPYRMAPYPTVHSLFAQHMKCYHRIITLTRPNSAITIGTDSTWIQSYKIIFNEMKQAAVGGCKENVIRR